MAARNKFFVSLAAGTILIALNHLTAVVAGLVPATPNVEGQKKDNRGGRDKPGHDAGRSVPHL
jgi:hypothetical protein